jgi:anti-sigma factor RsiW
MGSTNPVGEIDLNAYIDGQLDPARRIEVEEHLSHHADDAMRVMADLGVRNALRLALAEPDLGSSEATLRQARRLEKALIRAKMFEHVRQLAAAVLLVAVGWAGHLGYASWFPHADAVIQAAPSFVDDAMRAHRAAMVRADMRSQATMPYLDPEEIQRITGIPMPELPPEWRVRDVQVFPSSAGLGVEIALEAENLGPLSIFAARAGEWDMTNEPVVSRQDDAGVVYWRQGPWAYAVTGEVPEAELGRLAGRLVLAMSSMP